MADPALRDMGAHYAAARTRRNNGLMRETRMGASGVMNELAHDYFARAGRKIAPDAKVLANAHAFAEAVMDLAADNPRRGDALSRLAQGPQVAANLLGLVELIGPDAVRAQEGALQSA